MMASPIAPGSGKETVLVRGVNWLGDAVMTMPALARLRERYPDAHIALLSPAKLQDLWRRQPAVDSVLAFEPGESLWSVARRLKNQRFTVGLVLPNSVRSALELWLAGVPQRIGYAARWRRWFLTLPVSPRAGAVAMRKLSPAEVRRLIQGEHGQPRVTIPPAAHHVFHYLHLISATGASAEPIWPRLCVTDGDIAAFRARFPQIARGDRLVLGLNPGAEYGPAKRWPADRFLAAAAAIQRETRCQWLIFGGASDRGVAEEIARGLERACAHNADVSPPVVNLAGETTLRELCVGLKLCRVLLTNDTGPMHLAAAIGTAVVVPFGSTSPELTGPGLPGDTRHRLLRANVPCSPCFLRRCPIDLRCLTGISVEAAVRAVLDSARQA